MPGAFARTPLTSCGLTRSAIDAGMIEGTDRAKVRRPAFSQPQCGALLLTSLGVARQPATRVGSGKKVFYQGTSMVAVPFSKGRETVADIVNGPTYKRAPFKIEHNQPTPASRNTECFSEDSLQMNPANMKEYNPAAPNGSYDLTKPTSKGHASSVACVRSPPRCPLLPSWQLHSRAIRF